MKLLLNGIALFLACSSISSADQRQQYTVTGQADDVNAYYHDMIECNMATRDAQAKASEKCYAEGYNNGWIYAQYEECSSRLFGGKTVTMTFYCQ